MMALANVLAAQSHPTLCHPMDRSPWASLVTQMVKNLCALQETWVQSLG